MPIPVILLLAGQNSRFFPFNAYRHKALFELHGQSFLERTLIELEKHGYKKVTLIVSRNFDDDTFESLKNKYRGLDLQKVMQADPQGMADAVLGIKPLVAERVALLSAYHWQAVAGLSKMISAGPDSVISITETKEPWEYGIVELDGNKVTSIVEKPAKGTEPSNLKLQSFYVLSPKFFTLLSQTPATETSFEETLNILCSEEKIAAVQQDLLMTLKYPWHLFDVQQQLWLGRQTSIDQTAKVAPTAVIDDAQGPVIIEAGAIVGHATRIVGPCFIGQNARIGDFNLIRSSSIERHVDTGPFTEVARSIVGPHSSIHRGYVGDSIVEDHVKIGAGFITANKRFDREAVSVEVKGKKVDTGRVGFGTLIGSHSNIGIGSQTLPGKLIGANCMIFPGSQIAQNVPHDSKWPPVSRS